MKIPRHWASATYIGKDPAGKELSFSAWGWSSESIADAKAQAAARAKRIFDRLGARSEPAREAAYDYLETPLREEIVETVRVADREVALVTRNRYGALVLNSAAVFFADVDFPPEPRTGLLGAIRSLFSSKPKTPRQDPEQATVQKVLDWARQNPARAFRLYRTRAGLRLLFTDKLYEPLSPETTAILTALESDALYRRLTEKQQSFRARLTPKPWRCECPRPPARYPFPSADAERSYRDWEREYAEKTGAYKTCQLVQTIGSGPTNDQIAAVVALHDRHACAAADQPLA